MSASALPSNTYTGTPKCRPFKSQSAQSSALIAIISTPLRPWTQYR